MLVYVLGEAWRLVGFHAKLALLPAGVDLRGQKDHSS